MDPSADFETSPPARRKGRAALVLLHAVSALVALASAIVIFCGVAATRLPTWAAIAAALAVYPVLPLLWHLLAERARDLSLGGTSGGSRFALRALAMALVVGGAAVATAGPSRVRTLVSGRLGGAARPAAEAPPTPSVLADAGAKPPPPSAAVPAPHPLARFVPGDAAWALGLEGPTAITQLLQQSRADRAAELDALERCHIDAKGASVIVAAGASSGNEPTPLLVVVRAPGITDEGNLYCLSGLLGRGRFDLEFAPGKGSRAFTVKGLIPGRTLSFAPLDGETLMMVEEPWRAAVDARATGQGASLGEGRLAAAMARLPAGAGLWLAGRAPGDEAAWDLALAVTFSEQGCHVALTAKAPSEDAPARLELDAPLSLAAALPAGALMRGLTGVVEAILATRVSAPFPAAPPGEQPAGSVPAP